MDKKLLLSFVGLAGLLSSCSDENKEAVLEQEATLITCQQKWSGNQLCVHLQYDTDGNWATPEYFSFYVYDPKILSENAVNQYEEGFAKLKIGTKAPLKSWVKLIPMVAKYKE